MIVADTSALIAVAANEIAGPPCAAALNQARSVAISAGTLTETLIVSRKFDGLSAVNALLRALPVEIVPIDEAEARSVHAAYMRWGKRIHPADLNWGDCYAYSLASRLGRPLLYIGKDFGRTDVRSVLPDPTFGL